MEAYGTVEEIAIIGMAGRFPGAKNLEEFWKNLQTGLESISVFTDAELIASGIDQAVLNNLNYVKTGAIVEDIELFDASFFDFNPKEAETTDPQHRLFLECAWEALEKAGYDSQRCKSRIGVYAGASLNNYLSFDVNHDKVGSAKCYQTLIGNDKDFLTTRVSYKLNLTGPSITVQTACSTSLVATTLACQSLLNYQCDMALVGGVSIRVPQKTGYLYEEGGTLSPDGHCRAFDAKAQGIIIGNGVGVVVLKRLADAIADGDCIQAVIKGAAINNDGSLKVGYTAPSVKGQAEAIAEAMMLARVEPETINYIEAHGTGTALGDPIEIAALTNVFRASTEKKGFCAIGSVKTNIGHLDAAAGIAGLIKTVLALQHQSIPPSLNFNEPNPQIDFANSPFYVNTTLTEWKAGLTPRRAGVSSLGIGGTNAHLVLEEAPVLPASSPSRPWQLLLLCAKTESALETATENLAQHLRQNPHLNLGDVAYTLQVGRREFNHRRMLVGQTIDDTVKLLESLEPQQVLTHYQEPGDRPVVFMFPGQGTQYVDMGKELYQREPKFQQQVDYCCEVLKPHLGLDLRSQIYPNKSEALAAAKTLKQTDITQPALFVIEYALAQLWMSWGISPQAMIGHSIGEYVAACLAGVMSLEEALALVATRGRLMQQLPTGAMLSIPLSETEVNTLLSEGLSLAATNEPASCVVSGSHELIDAFQEKLAAKGVDCGRLHTSHAFHSSMMDSILESYKEQVQKVKLNPPNIPFISNVTGRWITATEATDPHYWARHLRQTVKFSAGITQLLCEPNHIFLEVGAGRTLSTLVKKHFNRADEPMILSSLRHPQEEYSDVKFLLSTLGKLWLMGVPVDWSSFYASEHRHRLPLPTYPFERQRYWIEPQKKPRDSASADYKKPDIADWFYVPVWKQAITPIREQIEPKKYWLVFVDTGQIGSQIAKHLELSNQDVITVVPGERFSKLGEGKYTINPQQPNDYDALLEDLQLLDQVPDEIIHLWSLTPNEQRHSGIEFFENCQNLGFYSLLFLAQAIGKQNITSSINILVVTNDIHDLTGVERLTPEKATGLGMGKVIPQEFPNITCRSIDVVLPASGTSQENQLIDQLIAELTAKASESVVAHRGHHRWVQTFEPVHLDEKVDGSKTQLREGGVYLITGGLGGIGLEFAQYLAQTVRAKLILLGRSAFPNTDEWETWLKTHDEQDPVSRKIQKLQALKDVGAEVLVLSADVASESQMQAAIAQSLERFGQIDGVIHAAGLKLLSTIRELNKIESDQQLRANGHGLFVLEKVLQGIELDFCLLISSISSVVGVLGMAAYPAAHLFTDAFVYKHNQENSVRWISVNWDNWLTRELAERLTTRPEISTELFMTPEEGLEVFKRVLSLDTVTQVVTSTVDLNARIEQWTKGKSVEDNQINSPSLYSRPSLPSTYIAPRNEVEQTLANIWQEILGIEQIGIYDNFLELGGDSLLSIQITARANKMNLRLTNQQIFEYPTIAELAEVASKTETILAEQGIIQGLVPLTPTQHWFFEQNRLDVHHWNQAILLEVQQPLNLERLEQVVQHLLIHHDALRLRFLPEESSWKQVNASPNGVVPFSKIDLSALSPGLQEQAFEAAASELQGSFNLGSEPLVRVAFFDLGEDKPNRLLFIIHHLLVDVGSWRILLEDLETAYQQLSQGQAIQLAPKTTSFKQWAERLTEYAQSTELQREQVYWLAASREWVSPLPVDDPGGDNIVASVQTVSVTLSVEETQTLLETVSAAYRVQIEDVLLAALAQAFAKWTGVRSALLPRGDAKGERSSASLSLLVDLEGNGRDVIFDRVDVSRTVGWFTTIAPVLLNIGEEAPPQEALKQVKEQLRNFPNQGIGYGALRYLNEDEIITEQLRSLPEAEILFLYLGQLDQTLPESSLFEMSQQFSGSTCSPRGKRSHLFEINGSIAQSQLRVDWSYSENVYRRETVEGLSQEFVGVLRSLITSCQSSSVENYTPSDFAQFKSSQWNQADLDNILAAINKSESFEKQ
ncbi:SDR family NAD(P)-dependent oxidoreductase [Coleofasciculus sp. E2-BRE-01]|uniref:SDR family NAD(P)-dependent oxidoreductase n=1 Tax=Coleofasciculus sp. E2-BRE-01 TaxID=3069524 RepID=UPI0033033D12